MRATMPRLPRTAILIWLVAQPLSGAALELDAKVRDNFDLATLAVAQGTVAQQWQTVAQVLDASPLVMLVADLHAARAADAASASELKRVQALYQDDNGVALKLVEAARAQAAADDSKLQSLRAQLLGGWGALARMNESALNALTQRILNGSTLLVRAELPGNAPPLPAQTVRLNLLPGSTHIAGQLLGAMPLRTEQTVGSAYLLSIEASSGLELQPGQLLNAELQDISHKLSGITVPSAAIVRWQGRHWVYVQVTATHYERKVVQVAQWLADGALVSSGLKAGDQVVTRGAGLLLGAELAPAEADAKE
jgi:multidrug efflux system membrane fusion protein